MAFKAREAGRPIDRPDAREDDRFTYPEDEPRSQFTAFLMGGAVVASGLLAFLYYDANGSDPDPGREPIAMESFVQREAPIRIPSVDLTRPLPPKPSAD